MTFTWAFEKSLEGLYAFFPVGMSHACGVPYQE